MSSRTEFQTRPMGKRRVRRGSVPRKVENGECKGYEILAPARDAFKKTRNVEWYRH